MDKLEKEVFVDAWKKFLTVEHDTTHLQIQSLKCFLEPLGYKLEQNVHTLQYRVKKVSEGFLEAPMFISFDKAVSMYNNEPCLGSRFLRLFTKEQLKYAVEAKIVEQVFLQRVKGGIKAQKYMVKFVQEDLVDPMENY